MLLDKANLSQMTYIHIDTPGKLFFVIACTLLCIDKTKNLGKLFHSPNNNYITSYWQNLLRLHSKYLLKTVLKRASRFPVEKNRSQHAWKREFQTTCLYTVRWWFQQHFEREARVLAVDCDLHRSDRCRGEGKKTVINPPSMTSDRRCKKEGRLTCKARPYL